MASVHTTLLTLVLAFILTPGMLISLPPGPNKKWFLGGQVTFLNGLVHATVIAGIVFLFGQ